MSILKNNISTFLKGVAMGTANIIPGVSGGTIALITGIFERLINSIKSFNLQAIKLLFKGDFKSFTAHTDIYFLVVLFAGVGFALLSLARLFDFLFTEYPIFIWSYFFGLILASVYFVGKTVEKWTIAVIIAFVAGTSIAIAISFVNPATQNSNFLYLVLCGIVAVCSMILPGLSGSFMLILMGNYQLVAIDAIKDLNDIRFDILLPVLMGAVFGLIGFSYFLSWLYKKFKNQTIAALTGFILGSLAVIWPWKNSFDSARNIIPVNEFGAKVDEFGKLIKTEVFAYERILPNIDGQFFAAIVIAILGFLSIYILEKKAGKV